MIRPLDVRTRAWFEKRFDADLSTIRVHAHQAADAVARNLGADAFAIGDDIFFAAGHYPLRGLAGRRLLAHELTHALQQRLGSPRAQDASLCEAEAAEAALAVAQGASWRCSVADQAGTVRCAATIKPGSAQVNITSRAMSQTPTVSMGNVSFECSTDIAANGSVILDGSQPAVGWRLGFIQMEWIDTNWLYYRGQQNQDGSIFFQRSRAPSRPSRVCRDVDPPGDVFYTDSWNLAKIVPGDVFPLTLSVNHADRPQDSCDAVVVNSKTAKPNFLQEAQLEFLFCTVLSAQDPAGKFHHLKSFFWNVRWQAKFQPASFANPNGAWNVASVAKGQGQATSNVHDGGPNDPRFSGKLTDMSVPACNALVALYTNMPPGHACRHESKVWTSFDVNKK
jgi:hypothetical protein